MYPREFGACDEASTNPLEECGITNVIFLDQSVPSPLPSGVTRGVLDNVELPNTYSFDGSISAMLPVDGTVVNNLLRTNTTIVFATWIQIRLTDTYYIYCMGREFRNYRHFCIYYRGNGRIDLIYQRQYRPGIDESQREIAQAVIISFSPTAEASLLDERLHFYQLQLIYRPDGSITLEMLIDGNAMQAFVVRYRDAEGNQIEPDIPDPSIVTLPFRPEPVATEVTDMVAFIGARYNKASFNLNGLLGRMLIFPYQIDSNLLNCYTSCNELLFLNGPTSTAITTTYNGIDRTLTFDGAASITDYITLLQQIAFSTSNPISGTRRYVKLQVSRWVI